VTNNSKISSSLSEQQKNQLLKLLFTNKGAFATTEEPFGAIRGHEFKLTLTIDKPYPPCFEESALPC
jgi:hypothetical protein